MKHLHLFNTEAEYENVSWTTGDNGIPSGWTVEYDSDIIEE